MTSNPPPEFFSQTRVEAFSDGVFAIIVTLLVLELKVPALPESAHGSVAALGHALLALLPKFGSWVVSFFMVGVTWANHHRVLGMFRHVSRALFWLNLNLLLWISLIPFPTALIGDYFTNPLALAVFGFCLGITTVAFSAIRCYGLRYPGLLRPDVNLTQYRRGTWRSVYFGVPPYLLGALLGWLWPPAALLLYVAVPLYFVGRDATRTA